MSREPDVAGRSDAVREFRLEGVSLWASAAVLILLLALAFWAGRATAPRMSPDGRALEETAAAAVAEPREVPVEENLSFFDRASGQGQAEEPKRQSADVPAPANSAPAKPTAPPGGEWFVQVFAGRDREAAELVARQVRGRGHPVRLDAEREGSGSLFKVRVGGYPSREDADRAAATLRKEGSSGAWVTRITD